MGGLLGRLGEKLLGDLGLIFMEGDALLRAVAGFQIPTTPEPESILQ